MKPKQKKYLETIKSKIKEEKIHVINDKTIEAVIYPSCKRNVVINGHKYFLQIPDVLAIKIRLKQFVNNRIQDYCVLSVYLTHNGKVYNLPFCANTFAGGLGVCLNFHLGHVYYKPEATLDVLMKEFWWSEFHHGGVVKYFKSFHDWQRMDLAEILEKLDKDAPSIDKILGDIRMKADSANGNARKLRHPFY